MAKPLVCRICLQVIFGQFEILCDVRINMLKILNVQLNTLRTNSVVCPSCSRKLQQSFSFKETCLHNDNYLTNLQNNNRINTVNLIQTAGDWSTELERTEACRFCLKHISPKRLVAINVTKDEDMVLRCFPEIDLTTPIEPKVCCLCLESIRNIFNFISMCCNSNDVDQKHAFLIVDKTKDHGLFEYTLELNETNIKREAAQRMGIKQEQIDYDLEIKKMVLVADKPVSQKMENFRTYDQEYQTPLIADHVPKGLTVKQEPGYFSNPVIEKEDDYCNRTSITPEREIHIKEEIFDDESNTKEMSERTTETDGKVVDKRKEKSCGYKMRFDSGKHLKIYICYHCSFRTNLRSTLILHLSVHKGSDDAPKFNCPSCQFVTRWKSSLRTHLLLHKNLDELKMYSCLKCEYRTKLRKHLRRHMKTHARKVHFCDHCSYQSKYFGPFKSHNLKSHKVKVELKPETLYEDLDMPEFEIPVKVKRSYKCEFCTYETHKSSRIKEHVLKHQGLEEVELFKCHRCTFLSKYKASLRHHQKVHDKKDRDGTNSRKECRSRS